MNVFRILFFQRKQMKLESRQQVAALGNAFLRQPQSHFPVVHKNGSIRVEDLSDRVGGQISRRGNSRADDIFSRSSRAGMAFYLEAVQPAVLCGKKINPDHLKR